MPQAKAKPVTYADAGVDITSGDAAKERIKTLAKQTFNKSVLGGIGGFGALFAPNLKKYKEPVLVSSADGVGTKLKIAFELGVHDTVGQDLVNHCVNDIAVQGAEPLFMLDYLATGRLESNVIEQVVSGLAKACKENGCALIGGETAQMPGFYADGEYDLAGFIVGIVDRKRLITGKEISEGDVFIGLPSTGLHTNGYSLARKLLFEVGGHKASDRVAAIEDKAGAALLKVHRSYLPVIRELTKARVVAGMAHITGGGITENLPRILPKGIAAEIDTGSWTRPPLFTYLQQLGSVPEDEMLRTFNLGIGLIVAVPQDKFKRAQKLLGKLGETFHVIGQAVRVSRGDDRRVHYRS